MHIVLKDEVCRFDSLDDDQPAPLDCKSVARTKKNIVAVTRQSEPRKARMASDDHSLAVTDA